jgi:DNA-binding winged helix-turn-helix (wHTH) protein
MPARFFFEGGWFEPITGRLEVGGGASELRPRTAAVLACLIAAPGRVVARKELFDTVWHDTIVGDESLAQCIKEIRQALGARAGWIRTVPRIGYAFTAEVSDRSPAPAVAPKRVSPGQKLSRRAAAAGATVAALLLATGAYRGSGPPSPRRFPWWCCRFAPTSRSRTSPTPSRTRSPRTCPASPAAS